jgi:hypothetical protein
VRAVADEEQHSTVKEVHDRIPRDRPLGVIHSGSRYLFGFGPESYAIWDAAREGPPIEEFPATRAGRTEGWNRYAALEPAVQNISADQSPGREEVDELEEPPSHRRALLIAGGIVLALIIAIVAFAATRPKPGPSTTNGGKTGGGKTKAHLDISGSATVSEDLALKSFTSPGSVLSGVVRASWEGAKSSLKLAFENIAIGEFPTTAFPERTVTITYTGADGSKVEFKSSAGECTIKIDKSEPSAISGSFDCTGASPGSSPGASSPPVDIKGTFDAST